MVNRIHSILNHYNLTAAKLADKLEVPRSTISHILSERNKPSLEFIQRIMDHYPEINIKWLLKGEGNIIADESSAFSAPAKKQEKTNISLERDLFTSNSPIESKDIPEESIHENLRHQKKSESESYDYRNQEDKANQNTSQTEGKTMVKIITFYSDNTFEEFYPK